MKRFLCLRFPLWPIQRLLAVRPELRGRALVLHERDSRQVERVVTSSLQAAAVGIEPGMPLGEALALYQQSAGDRSQELVALPAEPAGDWEALQQWAERCERFSPIVGWDPLDLPSTGNNEQRSLDYLMLDITGIGPLFGSEERLVEQLGTLCREQGYAVQLAVAETIGGAWALTAEGDFQEAAVSPGCFEDRADLLPITALRLEERTTRLLLQLGIKQIGELRRLPREGLATRFGQQVLLRLDRVFGSAVDTLIPFRPPAAFSAAWRLEYPTERLDILTHVIQRLLERIAAALTHAQQGALRLECLLESTRRKSFVCQVGLYRPAAAAAYLWSLLQTPLEQMRLTGEVSCVQVAATLAAPLEQHQQQLFADSTRTASRELALLLDRLGSRLGMHAVLRYEATGDALPERAFEYVSLVGESSGPLRRLPGPKRAGRSKLASDSPRAALERLPAKVCLRPLTLFPEPQPIEALIVAPDGPPESFLWRGRQRRVLRHWGPERIETGWQRGPTVRRDYYRIETTQGEWFWIFRRLPRQGWFLHGAFD